MKRGAVLTLSGLVAVAIGLFAWLMLHPGSPASPVAPGPSGYTECVDLGAGLAPGPVKPEELKPGELRALVVGNAEALQRARLAMNKPWLMPLAYTAVDESNHLAHLGSFKRLAQAFVAEGRQADQEQRYADACRAYVDALQLGHLLCREGTVIDVLVGVACQSIGCRALTGLRSRLAADECRVAIRRLELVDALATSPATMVANERAWRLRVHGWRGQLTALAMSRPLQQTEQGAAAKLQAQLRANRRLIIDLASRAHEVEKGQPPETVANLVPAYLARLPVDPDTGVALGLAP